MLTLDPVTIEFKGVTCKVQSVFKMEEGTGEVEIIRRVFDTSDVDAEIVLDEFITACYGTTEYPEDMSGIKLTIHTAEGVDSLNYEYQCRESEAEKVDLVDAVIPQVDSRLSMRGEAHECTGYFREGFAFSPMYTIGLKKKIMGNGEIHTWLKVAKAS